MNAIAHRVVIGYGSESGNARALAQQLAADPALQPFSPQVLTLNEISPGMLQDGNPLFIISGLLILFIIVVASSATGSRPPMRRPSWH